MAKAVNMRGLKVFITDIRNCKNPEDEEQRVDRELANIRGKFKAEKNLTDYEKKKYVWKLLYIHMLGYNVEFGHVQGIDLMSAQKYAEKQVGYMVTSVLVNEHNDFLRLSINAVRNDIVSRNEGFQCLALAFAANIGGSEFSEALASDVMKLLVSNTSRPIVKKKAALCLLRLYRKNSDILTADIWATKMASILEENDIGVLGTCVSLLTAIAARDTSGYEACMPKLVSALERLARARSVPQDHTYYGIPSPWLQIRLMRCLQYFPPPEDPDIHKSLSAVVKAVLTGTDVVKNVNKNNASHAVLFEAMSLVMHLDCDHDVVSRCLSLLGKFISVREPNIRYLGLENLARLALLPQSLPAVRGHLNAIMLSLKDNDISIRRQALDLLFTMCDSSNSKVIVSELMEYLNGADVTMREELSLKIAILAEKFATDLSWYVEIALGLIESAGEFISEHVWFRVVQIITNNPEMQEPAVRHVHNALKQGCNAEPLINTAAYIMGEFSKNINLQDMPSSVCKILLDKIPFVSRKSRGIIMNALAKLASKSDERVQAEVKLVFKKYTTFVDVDLQQRAAEYLVLVDAPEQFSEILETMPDYPQRDSNATKLQHNIARPSLTEKELHSVDSEHESPSHGDDNLPFALADLLAVTNNPNPNETIEGIYSIISIDADSIPEKDSLPYAKPISLLGDRHAWFRKLICNAQGILCEDDYLQIGVRQEYNGADAQITLFLGNKNAMHILDDLNLTIGPVASYQTDVLLDPPKSLVPKAQNKCVLSIRALAPALETPSLTVKYRIGAQMVVHQLHIPCVNTKFMTPVFNMQSTEFFRIWQSNAGMPLKVQEVVARPHSMNAHQVASLLMSLNFGVQQGLDVNQHNIVAAASYLGGSPQPVSMVLVRIEIDPTTCQQFRVTVSSSDPALTSTTKESIKQLILSI